MVSVPGSQPGRWRSQGTAWLHRLSALGPSERKALWVPAQLLLLLQLLLKVFRQTSESHGAWLCAYKTSRKRTELIVQSENIQSKVQEQSVMLNQSAVYERTVTSRYGSVYLDNK